MIPYEGEIIKHSITYRHAIIMNSSKSILPECRSRTREDHSLLMSKGWLYVLPLKPMVYVLLTGVLIISILSLSW